MIDGGVAPVRSRIAGEEELDLGPEVFQMTGDHEAIATVVPPAAGDRHPQRRIDAIERGKCHQQVSGVPPGVLHQNNAGEGVVRDRPEIDSADLFAGEGLHCRLSCVGEQD